MPVPLPPKESTVAGLDPGAPGGDQFAAPLHNPEAGDVSVPPLPIHAGSFAVMSTVGEPPAGDETEGTPLLCATGLETAT